MDKRYRRRIVKPGVEYYLTRVKDYLRRLQLHDREELVREYLEWVAA